MQSRSVASLLIGITSPYSEMSRPNCNDSAPSLLKKDYIEGDPPCEDDSAGSDTFDSSELTDKLLFGRYFSFFVRA